MFCFHRLVNPEMHIAQSLNMKKSQRVDASAFFRVSKTLAICTHFKSEVEFVKSAGRFMAQNLPMLTNMQWILMHKLACTFTNAASDLKCVQIASVLLTRKSAEASTL
jgi:hypothetical protein